MTYKAIPIEDYYLIVSDEECEKFKNETIVDGNFYPINAIAQSKPVHEGIPLFDAPWEVVYRCQSKK